MSGHIFQINISDGGVPKQPIRTGVVHERGIVGDRQNDTKHHGGPTRALCLYALETILELQREGHPVFPGSIGENITLVGVDFSTLKTGDRLQLGPAVLIEVTQPATPCSTIEESFKDGKFKRISAKLNPGQSRLYARVISGGSISIGDPVTVAALAAAE